MDSTRTVGRSAEICFKNFAKKRTPSDNNFKNVGNTEHLF